MRQGHIFRSVLLATSALVPLGLAPAYSNPQGGQVVGGSAAISTQGSTTTITQTTDRAAINWNTFNINAGETTRFVQPNAGSIALNRVTGGLGPSTIYGNITANGQVWIINPAGILIGSGAVVNTAGFLATTSDIKTDDFMAGRYNFIIPGRSDASVVNLGTITAANGGFAALVAPGVRNSGTITAKFGKVALASSNTFSLDFYGDGLITLGVNDQIAGSVKDVATGATLKSLVTNDGTISANGGTVQLTAVSARQIVDSVINTSGVIEARSIGRRNGMIVLGGQTSKTKIAGSATQTVKVSGTLDVSGKKKGGTVKVTGENIQLASANIKATGRTGGGTVMIGGDTGGGTVNAAVASIEQAKLSGGPVPTADTVSVDANSVIDVSATKSGNGGKAIVWSDLHTVFAGTVLAKGGAQSGNGGFVEVSGKQTLAYGGKVDTTAAAGVWGTLLLDPTDITISGSPSSYGAFSGGNWAFSPANTSASNIYVGDLLAALGSNNVIITTASNGTALGNITVNAAINWSSPTFRTLTLIAAHNIIINDAITGANLGLALSAGNEITTSISGDVTVGKFTLLAGNWIQNSANLPLFSTNDFRITGGSFLRVLGGTGTSLNPYLITDIYGLQGIGSSATLLSKNYALQNNIDASYTNLWNNGAGFVPIGNSSTAFTGQLDGQDFEISSLTIAPTSTTISQVGLFGVIGTTGVVHNLDFTGANITANPNYSGGFAQYVGVLAGSNLGTVDKVTAQGTITGGTATDITVGGLVGRNGGFISNASPVQGLITSSSANVAITTGDGTVMDTNLVGGLVGDNPGTIVSSEASGAIIVGSNTIAGGLVGRNMIVNGSTGPQPLIEHSWATGSVTSTGTNVGLGGLVGYNWGSLNEANSGMIKNSRATGAVTANAPLSGTNCAFLVSCDFAWVGGLVGFNQGFIQGTTAPVAAVLPAQGAGTYAIGYVSVGSGGTAGGLVGQNDGIIDNALATGTVVGSAGLSDNRSTMLGGFVGQNNGLITNSTATGNVGSAVAYLQAGGFAGHSGGAISDSHATGNVVAGNNSSAGGFASDSASSDSTCFVCNLGVGYNNVGVIADSTAIGSVTVGSISAAGGFVAFSGTISGSSASGAVTGGGDSILGGFAAVIPTVEFIVDSHASGNVTSNGANSWLGGFAGVNAGFITTGSSATGAVQATSDSVVGGFVGVNIGQINSAATHGFYTMSPQLISVSGGNNIVGGLVGANFGTIVNSTSLVAISGNASDTMGTLVGANGNMPNVAPGQVFGSSFPLGVIVASASGGTINGGSGPQVGSFNLAKMPNAPQILRSCDDTLCQILLNPKLSSSTNVTDDELDKLIGPDVFATALIFALNNDKKEQPSNQALIALPSSDPAPGGQGTNANTASTNNGSTGTRTASQTPGAPPPAPPPPPLRPISGPDGERFSSIPPITENRFIQNEVVLQMGANVPLADVQRIAQGMGLTILSQQSLNSLGRNAFRFSVSGGRSVRDVIRALEANSIVAVAQPNYQYNLSQAAPAGEHKGDPAQYMVEKLQLEQVHKLVSGKNVTIAVIDSEADKQHTELQGQIAEQFNSVGEAEKAHSHGTAMVGAIASRDRLLGVAPGAKILAVRAFSETQQSAEGTTFHILKSIDWAVSQGARVINMSFAGPRDPALERTLKRAYDQGVVLVAAAGNAGPKSPPLYPGADPSVIAVTATDAVDRGFKMANQGPHVSVASPGVDVLAPAPQESYQMSTGTSIATAHVSGVVALMLERDPTLTPADVRKILESTATDLGPKGKDTQFGWGLVNPQKALQLVDERKRKMTEAQPAFNTASR